MGNKKHGKQPKSMKRRYQILAKKRWEKSRENKMKKENPTVDLETILNEEPNDELEIILNEKSTVELEMNPLNDNPLLIGIDSRKHSTMKYRCSNCNRLFDDNDPGHSKIEIEKEANISSILDKRIEISVYDAIAYIYGLSFDDLLEQSENDWELIKCNQYAAEFDDEQFCDRHSDSVSLCATCLVPFSQVYNAHRRFNKVSTSDSVFQKAVNKLFNRDKDEYTVKIETDDCGHIKDIALNAGRRSNSLIGPSFRSDNFPTFNFDEDPETLEDSTEDPLSFPHRHTDHSMTNESAEEMIALNCKIEDLEDVVDLQSITPPVINIKRQKLLKKPHWLGLKAKQYFLSEEEKILSRKKRQKKIQSPTSFNAKCCGQVFDSMHMFYTHKEKVHGERTLQESCTVCNEIFAVDWMRFHMRVHCPKQTKFHKCTQCSKLYVTQSDMQTHRKTHSKQRKNNDDEKLTCPDKERRESKTRRQVVQKFRGALPIAAPLRLSRRFGGTEMCTEESETHVRKHQVNNETTSAPPTAASSEPKPGTICCRICGASVEEMSSILEMSHGVNGEKCGTPPTKNLCGDCNQIFVEGPLEKERRLQLQNAFCSICNIEYKTRQGFRAHHLRKHKVNHTNRLTLVCERCGKSSIPKKDFRRHMRKHEDEGLDKELFKCKECGKYFKDSLVLGTHIRRFHREDLRKTYTCPTCGKTTRNMTNMRIHERVHDPTRNIKRPYVIRKASQDSKTTKEVVVDEAEDSQLKKSMGNTPKQKELTFCLSLENHRQQEDSQKKSIAETMHVL